LQQRLPVRGRERPVGGQLQFCPSSLRLRGQHLQTGRGMQQGGAKSHLQLQRWRRLPHRFDLLRHGLQEPAHRRGQLRGLRPELRPRADVQQRRLLRLNAARGCGRAGQGRVRARSSRAG
jgi:hypothetical protein